MEKGMKYQIALSVLKIVVLLIIGDLIFSYVFTAFGFKEDVETTSTYITSVNGEETVKSYTEIIEMTSTLGSILAIICSVIFMFSVIIVADYNRSRRLKTAISEHEDNIYTAKETSDRLTVKANRVLDKYLNHESDIQKTVAMARGGGQINQDGNITNSQGFRVVVERYPDLRANESVLKLLYQIEQCEFFIANEKLAYNKAIAVYNYMIYSFPFVLLRKKLGLERHGVVTIPAEFIPVTDEELGI